MAKKKIAIPMGGGAPAMPDVAVAEAKDVKASMSVLSQSPEDGGGIMNDDGIADKSMHDGLMDTEKVADIVTQKK